MAPPGSGTEGAVDGVLMISTAQPVTAIPVRIPIGGRTFLDADVAVPAHAKGVILFAHGSGSSRHSPRNRYVASQLNFASLATVLADLLTPEEEVIDDRTRALRFDIGMLTHRMIQVVDWVRTFGPIANLPIGIFGASTGAAAALDAAAARPAIVRAVVSRGGRPDLAANIDSVTASTLLIVGGEDHAVLKMNQDAHRRLTGIRELEVVPGATHLFEEPGTLERVANAAGAFFLRHLQSHELR